MPYIYDMPAGHPTYGHRAAESDQDYADSELLKLLNGGLGHSDVVPQREGYSYDCEEDESDTPSKQLLTAMSLHSTPTSMHPCSNIGLATPLPDPPFISDLVRLSLGHPTPENDNDKQDDFTMKKRYPRMSFNGHAYPPVPPDPSTLPRPVDDWVDEDYPIRRNMRGHEAATVYPSVDRYAKEQAHYTQSNMMAYEPEPYMRQVQQPAVWTPPHAQAWSNLPAVDYHAPVLHPRLVHLPERPITPHDTYRYPTSHVEQIYVAPPTPEVSTETINAAFAVWYANQVIGLLVVPGQFRPGVGGASDDMWGPGGREREGWMRVGRTPPDYSKPWGRMGMTQTPVPAPRKLSRRRPDLEPRDPWNVAWAHSIKPTSTLVNFVLDMIQRMTITPTAIVTAVWFLAGLGLHDGDGVKGAQLRSFLRQHRSFEPEAIERRVATLGLMLAGKWLDDNSFLTKSWCEVTTVPVKQLDQMERYALADLHYSLHVPVSSWVDHVNKLYTSLVNKATTDDVDLVVYPIIDEMVTEARNVELSDPRDASPAHRYERRVSTEQLPAAADQAISRDWGTFARTYAHGQNMTPHWDTRGMEVDVEMERAERSVDALVNDEYMDEETELEEDEEEFLDYDGAKRWLPSTSELKRSTSLSSERSFDSADSYHSRVVAQPSQVFHHGPTEILETPVRQRAHSDWTTVSSKSTASSFDWENSDFLYPTESDKCQKCDHRPFSITSKRTPLGLREHNQGNNSFVKPPKYDALVDLDRSQARYVGVGGIESASKRWATCAAQW